MNNGDSFYLIAEGSVTNDYASGSISGVSTRNQVDGTGIIGITCSLYDADLTFTNQNQSWLFGTNYIAQQQAFSGSKVNASPYVMFSGGNFLSASLNPVVSFDNDNVTLCQAQCMDPGYLFDRIKVTPNPNELMKQIPAGKIYALTLRKRQEADNRVILSVNQPSGSQGNETLSGDGYLIPDDLTNIQQRNVQKIINKLQSENVFQETTPDGIR